MTIPPNEMGSPEHPWKAGDEKALNDAFKPTMLVNIGMHECVTCNRCALSFAKVHPACPACAAEWRYRGVEEQYIVAKRELEMAEGFRREAERENKELQEQLKLLIVLIRIAFLVTVDGERATAETVVNPELRAKLLSILQAKNSDAAIASFLEKKGYNYEN